MRTLFLMPLLAVLLLAGCDGTVKGSADAKQSAQTEKAMREADAQVGMPAIMNFQEKKLAKMIFELRDRTNLVCYAYIKSDYQGKLMFIGKCIGFGLPYSVQYTNPEKLTYTRHREGITTTPQPDPNGLFMPSGLSATWLMMIDPKTGDTRPVYIEPEIVVSPFPLHNTRK